METLNDWLELLKASDVQLFRLGKTRITLWSLLWLLFLIGALFYFSSVAQRWIARRLLARTHLDVGTREAVASMVRYLVLLIGLLIIMQTAGINLTTFNVLAGAVGVGIGFGLQNIVSNFISGLIIMLQRPIKVGDHIEVSGVEGDVIEIGARHTSLMTANGVTVIVPNSKFITEVVHNWEYMHSQTPLSVTVNVKANDVDPRAVEKILIGIAANHADVSKQPLPRVYFKSQGSATLVFELIVWTRLDIARRHLLLNDLNYTVYEALRRHDMPLS
ncbi:MAG TPA: mechanosensitive ion channel domain-containing protein [Burkholderiales bacterium]|nr:mechanosensitive ion channel domain-containing protein [Burkholderiales bacterium]